MESDLLETLRNAARRLFRGGPLLAAYAFGSRVAGRPLPDSDLDVGYYLRGYRRRAQLPLREEMVLAAELTAAAGIEVDFRNLAEAPLELRGKVLEEGIRIYSGHDAERVALERELLGRYHDYKETFQRMHRIRLRRLAAQKV